MITRSRIPFLTEKDAQIKIINERINITEKHFGELCSAFAAFNRKLGRFRDKHDDLAKIVKAYSEEEIPKNSLTSGLDSFLKAITLLADYIDLEVQRIDFQIVNELKQYENLCRNIRENLKTAVIIRDKEVIRQRQLIDLKSKFNSNASAADSELLKINIEVNRTNKEIENIIENFEKRKLKDVKTLLLDFIQIHLKHHTKAVEILSATYQDVLTIDDKKDFQNFRKSIRLKHNSDDFNKFRSQSVDNLTLPQSTPTKDNQISRSTKDLTKAKYDSNEDDENSSNGQSKDDSSERTENSDDEDEEEEEETEEDEEEDEDDESDDTVNKHKISSARISKLKEVCENVDITKNSRIPISTVKTVGAGGGNHLVTVKSINGISK